MRTAPFRAVGCALVAAATAAFAQNPAPKLEEPAAAPGRGAASIAAARKAIADGRAEQAFTPLRLALDAQPESLEVLALWVDACAHDEDARTFWQHELARAATRPGGELGLDAAGRKRLAPNDAALATARAAAVEELVRFAREREKQAATKPDAALVATWARRTALELARGSRALLETNETELSPRLRVPDALPAQVVRALQTFAENAQRNSRTKEAVEAARVLAGLGVQLGWEKDLQGPKPTGLGALAKTANELLAKARAQLASKNERPWTVEELEKLDADQAEAFTRAHDSLGNPGVAVSPNARYRIETDCGYETLLGTARTVELHHARLARWYGTDPFTNEPGLVRIVPEATGLEAEGAPFWWAGGFQGGDTTTLRFSCGDGAPTIEGLGHGLVHELTHRFDGALYPGLPAWLAEGKAVWTGGAYGASTAADFVENYASIGTIDGAFVKGYGDPTKLAKLIDGTIDDYRDNYVAGNALYVYLRSRKDASGRLLFRDALRVFQEKARTAKKPKEHFLATFCDGRDGRPKSFEDFCADWTPWIAGFYWQARKPWALEFTEDVGGADAPPVMDEPVWVWTRSRAEPRFGQEQAALAARIFLRAGERANAIAAGTWALAVDGRRPMDELAFADALEREGRKESAWAVRAELDAVTGARNGAPPFQSALPRTFAALETLGAAVDDASKRSLARTAGALRAERETLARRLGVAELAPLPAVDVDAPSVVFDGPPNVLARDGWGESGLTGYEERRAKGRHFVDEDGALVVGLEKPKAKATSTGEGLAAVDRAAAQIDCFALAPEWVLAGSWRLDCRVRFLTSFVSGCVVLGYRERDDNVRFSFGAGDFDYAIGASEKQEHDFTDVNWSITGLRDRDGGLVAGTSGGVHFDAPRSTFWLSLVVDGPVLRAFVDGKPVGRYVTVDGAPIEGRIGFATGMGALRVEDARLARLERSRRAPAQGREEELFALDDARSVAPWDAANVASRGLPRVPQGTLLAVVPAPETAFASELDETSFVQRATRGLRDLSVVMRREQPTQPLVVAFPASLGAKARAELEAAARKELGEKVELRAHAVRSSAAPPPADSPKDVDTKPANGAAKDGEPVKPDASGDVKADAAASSRARSLWLLFLDQAGTVRAASRVSTAKPASDEFLRWLRVFREHGRPERTLPSIERVPVGGR